METFSKVKTSVQEVTENVTALPLHESRFVILTNPDYDINSKTFEVDITTDRFLTSENIVFWGYNGQALHPLIPGETTMLVPVTNTNNISLQTKTGVIRQVIFSYIL